MGLTPSSLQALYISTAPFITPWSVRPSAGCPNSAARLASALMLQAPSSSEYSEWTCRWGQLGVLTATSRIGGGPDGGARPRVRRERRSRTLRGFSRYDRRPVRQPADERAP